MKFEQANYFRAKNTSYINDFVKHIYWFSQNDSPFFFVIITFVIIITMSLLAMLLPRNMIANGCALSLLRVCTACAVPCPNTIIERTMAARKRDVNKITSIVSTRQPRLDNSIGLWLDGILRKDVLLWCFSFYCFTRQWKLNLLIFSSLEHAHKGNSSKILMRLKNWPHSDFYQRRIF